MKSSKKKKSCIAESEHTAAHKEQLVLFLLTGLIKGRELRFFGVCNLVARVCLALEFVHAIGVHEVLPCLLFHFPVGFDPIKKLGAVTRVFGVGGMICFNHGFIMPLVSNASFPSPHK